MNATLKRLGFTRVDKALDAHHVATGWLPRRWVMVCAVVGVLAALAASFAWLWQRERARVEALHSERDREERRITVVYEEGGLVCKVPAGREKVAPIIQDTCTMAARLIAAQEARQ